MLTQRVRPHVDGDWQSLVYLEVDFEQFEDLIEELESCLPTNTVQVLNDLHLSLSRPQGIRSEHVDLLIESLTERIKLLIPSRVRLKFDEIICLLNESQSQQFIALKVTQGESIIDQLVEEVDRILLDLGYESYFKEKIYHVSLFCAQPSAAVDLKMINEKLKKEHGLIGGAPWIQLKTLRIQIGNKVKGSRN